MEVERINYLGFDIVIYTDDDPWNPRDWDNLGTMVCCHGRYNLGDKQYYTGPEALYKTLLDFGFDNDIFHNDYDYMMGNEFLDKYFQKLDEVAVYLPLYLYDHSGITIKTTAFSCPWDSGQVGFIYIPKEDAKKEYSWKLLTKRRRQKLIDIMKTEVEIYDYFIKGEVYGFVIEPDNKEIYCDDSCWGFFGYETEDWKYMIDEAKANIRWTVKNWAKETAIGIVNDVKRRRDMDWFIKNCFAL